MKPKMKKIIKSSSVWLSQEYQEKHLAKHLDNKENLQNNSHIQIIKKIFGHDLSKKKKLSQINYKSKQNKSQIPNNLYPISTSHLRAPCPSQMTPPHSHRDNSYTVNHSIHTPISVTSNLDQLVSLTQPMKKIYFFKELLLFNTTRGIFFFFLNDRILLVFNVLFTLGHT